MLIRLPDPEIIRISGDDALAFAQAQFTSDVTRLDPARWQWSAWLSAQGRVRAFFALARITDGSFCLLLRGGSARRLRDALARFVLRAQVVLEVVADKKLLAASTAEDLAGIATPPDSGVVAEQAGSLCIALPGAPPRWLLVCDRARALSEDTAPRAREGHALADIDAGIPAIAEALEDQLLPDWLGLGALGAVSVRKGCYPGQEVVARMHFRGGNKRWPYLVDFAAAALPEPGTWIPSESENGALVVEAAWRRPGIGRALVVARDGADAAALGTDTFTAQAMTRLTANDHS